MVSDLSLLRQDAPVLKSTGISLCISRQEISATAAGAFLVSNTKHRKAFRFLHGAKQLAPHSPLVSLVVLLAGIEPASPPSEGDILSIELQKRQASWAGIH